MNSVLIDLTPLEYQTLRVGKLRLATACRGVACVLVFLSVGMMWLHIYPKRYEDTTLPNLKDEVVELERRIEQHAQLREAAQKAQTQHATMDAKRRRVFSILSVVSGETRANLSLSKITINPDEVLFEGAAQDAQALAAFLERIVNRCPAAHHLIDKMYTTSIANQSVESFAARVRFANESHVSLSCEDGGPHAGL